jgi:hypothetical protein
MTSKEKQRQDLALEIAELCPCYVCKAFAVGQALEWLTEEMPTAAEQKEIAGEITAAYIEQC